MPPLFGFRLRYALSKHSSGHERTFASDPYTARGVDGPVARDCRGDAARRRGMPAPVDDRAASDPVRRHPVWTLVADGPQAPVGSISADPRRGEQALIRLLTYAGLLWLSFLVGLDARWARRALVSVVLAGTAFALYGLLVFVSGNETI